jgi:hypothetical protein
VEQVTRSIKLHYSKALVLRAVRAFWYRRLGWKFFAAFFVLSAGLVFLLWGGERSWVAGLFGAGLGFEVLTATVIYVTRRRASLARYHRMSTPEATLELTEERLRMISDAGGSELAWSTITGVWRFSEFWLIFFSRGQFITLPTAGLDAASREFIVAQIKANGGKVV